MHDTQGGVLGQVPGDGVGAAGVEGEDWHHEIVHELVAQQAGASKIEPQAGASKN